MTTDIKLNDDNDISFDGGVIETVDGAESVRQRLIVRLNTFLGEWFLDENAGIPYYQYVLGQNPLNRVMLNAVFVSAILSTPGVLSLEKEIEYSYDGATRILGLSFSAVVSGENGETGSIEVTI